MENKSFKMQYGSLKAYARYLDIGYTEEADKPGFMILQNGKRLLRLFTS